MSREYYSYSYKLNGTQRHLIWISNDADGVYVEAGVVSSFDNLDDLAEFARSVGLTVETDESVRLDLDAIAEWLNDEALMRVDCVGLLDAWNLFDDVSRSIGGRFDTDKNLTKVVYDKLFWGNNLPAMTPEGEHFTPDWTTRELDLIRTVIGQGLKMFSACTARP